MRKALSALLAAAMLLSLAACGGTADTSSGDSGAASSGSGADDGHTLSIQAWDPAFNIPAIQAAADDYKANVDPDFNLELTTVSGSGDIETLITSSASAGEYSTLPDIVLYQDHGINRAVHDYPDVWTPIDDIDINWDDFSAEKVAYSTIDGVHYGVPVDGGTCIAAYRVDLLEAAGHTIDELDGCTWDEFIAIGEDVYAATGKYLACMDGGGNDLPYLMLQAEGVSQWKDGEPYLVENETFVKVIEIIQEMVEKKVLLLSNDWDSYTNEAIQGDQVAGVMNGNWIIPTMEQVTENSGKWEIAPNLPTINGGGGYASNGGSSLYITCNCRNVELAKDFLAKTFGSSTTTYDGALTGGGVVSTYIPAAESSVYAEPVEFFNNTPVYQTIAEMTAKVPTIEQSDYHYNLRNYVATAITNISNGADVMTEIQGAQDQTRFEMGL